MIAWTDEKLVGELEIVYDSSEICKRCREHVPLPGLWATDVFEEGDPIMAWLGRGWRPLTPVELLDVDWLEEEFDDGIEMSKEEMTRLVMGVL